MTTTDKIFRTKTGYCHITEDKLILSTSDNPERAAQEKARNNIVVTLILYGLVGLAFAYRSYTLFTDQRYFVTALFALAAIVFIINVFVSWERSSTPVIERRSISAVKFKKGIPGLTRPRFDVYFTTPSGKTRKRLILLPGSLSGGKHDSEEALRIMTSEKLITEFKQS